MRSINLLLLLSILLLPYFSVARAQKSVQAFFHESPPIIDGVFETAKWANADSATGFIQMEPRPGEPSTERTVAWFGFDNDNIYAVIKCYQKTPATARNQSRDALSKSDDLVAIIIDTYNDNRSGYGFFANPLGTQIDIKINDDGRNLDTNWDTKWKCESAGFEGGWCAEFMIPFTSLKFKKGPDTWGINFGRVIRSNFETVYWTGPLSDDFRISQGGKLTGLSTPGSGMQFTLFPYFSLFKTTGEKINTDAGSDLQWQITPNISLNGTINPDFATVEADEVKINLTRYELSYPEKRLFFQEGNEMYSTRIKTFYSRRIQDIDFGERLNGKIGDYQFNVVNVRTPELAPDDQPCFFTAARLKKDVLNSSSVGLTLVDKSGRDAFTRSISLDYVLNLGKTWQLTGQFVGSAPGDFWSHSAWYVRFARENNIFHYHFRYNNIGENFRETVNQTGFVTDDDRKEIDFEATYKFWIKNKILEYIDVGSNNNFFWSQTGILRSWNLDNSVDVYFRNRFNIEYNYNNEYKLYEKDFYNWSHEFTVGYNTEEWSHAQVGYSTGKNYDRDFYLVSGGGRIKLFQNLSLTYTASFIDFIPDPDMNSTFINVIEANYNFTKDSWIKVFAQNSMVNEKVYLYGLFGWRFKAPFGALYLIYSRDQYRLGESLIKSDNFFLKFTLPVSVLK
ncbi:MAG TPA: DUF5916 domain-containing protein [Bacteroidales bacterium]|nr:DUF5916 domain-containing protein [Bacteroidales bacterium]